MNQTFFEHTFSLGQAIRYRRLPSGTCYHADTPETVVAILEACRQNRCEIRLYYGDTQTGQSWLDEHDIIGYIGRSTGIVKVPLLVPPGDSGGPALLDHCIIRIDSPTKVLYQHGQFHVGDITLVQGKLKQLPWEVLINWTLQARFPAKREAKHYIDFLQGKRFALE
ncbi:hypothetical protein [Methylovulum miyakonense]|uniref:hypothetical protein n=1 Tax=Methylovulum miyakonense TaxID=645578 RepID=UPI000363C75D|nr:hypothetical protein [Methylovulum miyakonense]